MALCIIIPLLITTTLVIVNGASVTTDIPTGHSTKLLFYTEFSIKLKYNKYINETITCNFTLFKNSIQASTNNYLNNTIFDIDNLYVLNASTINVNKSYALIEINYQIPSNIADDMLDQIENTINSVEFKQRLMNGLENIYDKCLGISTTQLVYMSTEINHLKNEDSEINLLDWQNYNIIELVIAIAICVVGFIMICLICYYFINHYCIKHRVDTKQFKHGDDAATPGAVEVEIGGFRISGIQIIKPRKKKSFNSCCNSCK
eukprot:333079_1